MVNRKFNIKLDFDKLNELENTIIPMIDKNVSNAEDNETLKDYVRKIFNNQWKNNC